MNLAAPVTVLALVLTIASSAAAQGGRGAAIGSGRSSVAGQSGPNPTPNPTLSPTRSGTPGSVTITTVPKAAVTRSAPGVPIQSIPQAAVPQFIPPVVHGGGVIVAPASTLRHSPTVVIETARPMHRPPPA